MTRPHPGEARLPAFRHPSAGCQRVKGGLHPGEAPAAGALRERHEERGLRLPNPPHPLATVSLGASPGLWHRDHPHATARADTWAHPFTDDHGHVFRVFRHPLDPAQEDDQHPLYARLWRIARPLIAQRLPPPGRTS